MNTLTVALAQIDTVLGDVPRNLQKHLEWTARARDQGAGLIIFPELSLTGYALLDLAATVAHRPTAEDPVFAGLLEASRGIDMVVGFVEEDLRSRFFISAAYLSGGEVLHVHRKVYLPTYGMFDEGRFFAWGDAVRAFDTRFGRIGLLICEDFWHASPPYLLWLDGADLLIHIAASPGRGLTLEPELGSARWVEHINQGYASLFTNFVLYTNRTGFEDGLNFWGGATVFDPDGKLAVRGPYHQEELVCHTLDLGQIHRARLRLPLLRDERTGLMQGELNRILSSQNRTFRR